MVRDSNILTQVLQQTIGKKMICNSVSFIVVLGLLQSTCVLARGLYIKHDDWRWQDHKEEVGKESKQMWSWTDIPDNNIIRGKETMKNGASAKEPAKETFEKHSKRIPFHILSVKTATETPRRQRKRPRKQYVPFNR